MRKVLFLLAGLPMALACTSSTDSSTTSTGGTTGSGGTMDTGGTTGSSGTTSTSGTTSSGGATSTVGTGGTTSSGGATSTAGTGTTSTGGATSTGGTTSSGGTTSRGGRTGRGGTTSADGGSGTGGTTEVGGSTSSGGATSTGGTNSTGGSSADGGSTGDGGTTTVGCDRAGLEAAVAAYLAALESKDTSLMPLASTVAYTEVTTMASARQPTAIGSGLWQTAWPVKFSRSLLDVTGCETFSEVFITEGGHPYVLGTRLAIEDGQITEIYTLATDSDDWNFDAAAYDTCSESEDWSLVPAASQSTREELIAAGEAYFMIFSDKSTVVPWGNPCYRLEGGKGCTPAMDKASTSCNVGIPDDITFKNTHWVVDVDLNAAVGITLFAGASPDSHMFRLVDGKIRYIHTLTIMN